MTIFYNQVAYYLVYSIMRFGEKELIEQHILSTLPESQCEIINLTANADKIYWEKADEVFILNGVMYDITKIKYVAGNMYAYCITEEKEMEMVTDYSLKFNTAGKGAVYVTLSFTPEYILQNSKLTIKKYFSNSSLLFSNYSAPLTSCCKDIVLPPPRIQVS